MNSTDDTRWPRLAVLLAYLAQLPRAGVFLAALAVVLAGLFLPGLAGAVLLLVIVAGLVALLTVTWSRLAPPRRIMQLAVLVAVVAVAAVKLA